MRRASDRPGRKVLVVSGSVIVLLLGAVWLSPSRATRVVAQSPLVKGPLFGPSVQAKSLDRDLRRIPRTEPSVTPRIIPLRGRGNQLESAGLNEGSTPLAGSPAPRVPRASMPSPLQSVEGISFTGMWPPDTNGDVGRNYFIQAVNASFAIYDKSGMLLSGPTTMNSLWGSGGSDPCSNGNHEGDPIVLYDSIADRWLVSDLGFATDSGGNPQAPFYECIAISKTSNPVSGGWWFYALLADSNLLNDYPKIGLWSNAYYMTANMYDLTTNAVFVRVWALDRVNMLSGTLNQVHYDLPVCAATSSTCLYFSLLPSNLRGTEPPSGSANYLANIEAANTLAALPFSSAVLHLWKFSLAGSWPTPTVSFTGPNDVTVPSFTEPLASAAGQVTMNLIPQLGTSTKLDSLGDRLMMQLQYRSISGAESLWLAHTVNSGGVTGIRWYQVQVTGGSFSLTQSGTLQPDAAYRWMPSLAVDQSGNLAVGYSASSASLNPGIRYAGRLSTDPAGELSQGEAVLVNGGGSQTSYPSIGAISRWGDYSAMTVDPVDDCTFWYTQEYYVSTGYHWNTRIGSFKFPACGAGGTPTPTGTSSLPSTPTPTVTPTFVPTATPAPTPLEYFFPFIGK